jgi:Fe-S cluster assembly protein SufD
MSPNLVEAETKTTFSREVVEEISRRNGEPEWMLNLRQRAWTIYNEMPVREGGPDFPVSKRIDVRGLQLSSLNPTPERKAITVSTSELLEQAESIFTLQETRGGYLVQQNGMFVRAENINRLESSQVVFCDMNTALRDYPELVRKYFMTTNVQLNDSKYVALHGAFWNGGTFLFVPQNVTVELPLQSFFLLANEQGAIFPHTILVAESGSKVTFIDAQTSSTNDNQSLVNSVVEIFVEEGAQVQYITIQELGKNVYHHAMKRALMKKDSSLTWCEIALGSKVSKSSIQAMMEESGSQVNLLGLYFPVSDQQMEFDTLQVHASPHASSDLLYKGALRDKARSVFEGMIRVNKGAQKTNAYQANRNMLLSSESRAASIPKLEIEANDVRCTHGATVGPVNDDQLFYLMSRGLSKEEAIRLLVIGFFSEVIDRIPVQDVREKLLNHIEKQVAA